MQLFDQERFSKQPKASIPSGWCEVEWEVVVKGLGFEV